MKLSKLFTKLIKYLKQINLQHLFNLKFETLDEK